MSTEINQPPPFEETILGLTPWELFASNHKRSRLIGELADLKEAQTDPAEKDRLELERQKIGDEMLIVRKRYRELTEGTLPAESEPVPGDAGEDIKFAQVNRETVDGLNKERFNRQASNAKDLREEL